MFVHYDITVEQGRTQILFNEWNKNSGKYIVLDTETTALHDAEIIDIAAVSLSDGVLYNSLVQPIFPISEEASEIHGLTYDDVKNAPSWVDVWRQLYPIIKDKVLLIYNAGFDLRAMQESFKAQHIAGKITDEDLNRYHADIRGLQRECVMQNYANLINSDMWVKLPVAYGKEVKHRALNKCIAVREVITSNYKPEFTDIELERLKLYHEFESLDRQIRHYIYSIQEMSEHQRQLLQERKEISEMLCLDNDKLMQRLSQKKDELPF